MKRILIYSFFLILILGCDNKLNVYRYTEIHKEPEILPVQKPILTNKNLPSQQRSEDPVTQKMLMQSVSKAHLNWKTPADWIETPGTGIRIVTFKSNSDHPIECSIVSLGGMAGGLKANVTRWLRQINLTAIDNLQMAAFLDQLKIILTKNGQSAQMIDLTYFQNQQQAAQPAIIGAMISADEQSIFIKMTGTYRDVRHHYPNLINLIKFLEIDNE